MTRFITLCIIVCVSFSVEGQPLISWDTFAKVKMYREFDPNLGFEVNVAAPVFEREVLQYDGKTIRVRGYAIPVDVELNLYMVSANPFANCFFCGNAGPETVVELFPRENLPRFKTDEVVTFVGTLSINKGAVDSTVPYQLFSATVAK